jgi:hypothetical protein
MADQHDAQLLVQLAQWGSSLGLQDAFSKLMAEDFDPESASVHDPHVAAALQFFETVGTLTKNGLFDAALAQDWLWIAGVWARVGPAAVRMRTEAGEARLYENFEALAQSS